MQPIVCMEDSVRILAEDLVSKRVANAILVHPRELFKEEIRMAACAVILIHNHPGGVPTPSREDHAITKQLVESGKLLDIPVRDHVIICGSGYVSFAENGWL